MKNYNMKSVGGVGVTGLLQVAFIVLKLCNVINWSWWWVLAPSWISFALVFMILVILLTAAVLEDKKDRKKEKNRYGE